MANVAFDTLTASKDLQQAGFETPQAEAIALVIKNSQGDLATKADIQLLKVEIEKLRTEFNGKFKNLEDSLTGLKWSMAVWMAVMLGGFSIIFSQLP